MTTTNGTVSDTAQPNSGPAAPKTSVASAATKRRQSASKRRTTAQRAARSASKRRTTTQTKQPETITTQVAGVAESVVLIPVGVALEAGDRVIGAIRPWTSRTGAERELNRARRTARRFERR